MPEVIGAFLRAECGYKRADPAGEAWNGWFGSLPEMGLDIASLAGEDHFEPKVTAPAMGNHRSDETSSPARPQGDQPSSPPATSPRAEIDRFLDQVKAFDPVAKTGPRGRLVFAL